MRAFTRPSITVLVFFVLALVPVIAFDHGGPGYDLGSYGQVARAPLPKKIASDMFRRLGDWFIDRIGMRNLLVEIGGELSLGVLRISTNRNVLIGHHGWLFWNDYEKLPAVEMLDARGNAVFQYRKLPRSIQISAASPRPSRAAGRPLIAIAANKQSIYSKELLPSAASQSRLDDLLGKLDQPALSIVVDTRAPLRSAKRSQSLQLYYKTDTHWNELGAFEAYRDIVGRLDRAGAIYRPQLASLDQYDIVVEPFLGGDLSVRMLQVPWLFSDVTIHLRPKQGLPVVEAVSVNQTDSVYRNSEGRGRLVVIGDSFSPLLARFLSYHFAEVELHPYAERRFDGGVAAAGKADVEILEVIERNLPELLAPPIGLNRICGVPRL